MNIHIRLEEEKDYDTVDFLTREAFWNVYRPGCDEHYLAYLLRKSPIFIKGLDFVAEVEGKIVGNIMFHKAKIVNGDTEYEILSFGPVSVLPEYQNKGIGSALIRHGLKKALELGYKSVLIYGRNGYYKRFGFENAAKYRITTKEGDNLDDSLALELEKGALDGITGKFYDLCGIDYITGLRAFDQKSRKKKNKSCPANSPGTTWIYRLWAPYCFIRAPETPDY